MKKRNKNWKEKSDTLFCEIIEQQNNCLCSQFSFKIIRFKYMSQGFKKIWLTHLKTLASNISEVNNSNQT